MERIKELRAILGDEEPAVRPDQGGAARDHARSTATSAAREIIAAEGEIDLEDLIAEEQMVISITRSGYIKRLPLSTYRKQKRGGVGVIGMETKEDDYIEHLRICSTHDFLLFFTNYGKVYRLKVYELPEGARTAKGRALVNLLPLREGESRARRDRDARLRREQVPRVRDAQGPDQEDRADGLQHADPRATGSSRSSCATGTSSCRCAARAASDDIIMVVASPATPRASTSRACGRWAATPPACAA